MSKESRRIFYSCLPALFLVIIMCLVKLYEVISHQGFYTYGLLPHSLQNLSGIIFYPFIHGDIDHLYSNVIPFLILGTGMVYFYGNLAFKVFLLIFFLSGAGLWIGGRETYHIGASGLVYGMASFLFFSGVLRKDVRLMAISLIVTFLYGSMVWGVLPLVRGVSWEGHLFGALAGIVAAIGFRKEGPQRPKYQWELEEEKEIDPGMHDGDEVIFPHSPWPKQNADNETTIKYIYKPKDKSDEHKKN